LSTCVSQCLACDKLDKHLSHLKRCSKASMALVSWRTGVCKLLIINHYWKWTLLQLLLRECWGYGLNHLPQVFVSVHRTWAKQAQMSKIFGEFVGKARSCHRFSGDFSTFQIYIICWNRLSDYQLRFERCPRTCETWQRHGAVLCCVQIWQFNFPLMLQISKQHGNSPWNIAVTDNSRVRQFTAMFHGELPCYLPICSIPG